MTQSLPQVIQFSLPNVEHRLPRQGCTVRALIAVARGRNLLLLGDANGLLRIQFSVSRRSPFVRAHLVAITYWSTQVKFLRYYRSMRTKKNHPRKNSCTVHSRSASPHFLVPRYPEEGDVRITYVLVSIYLCYSQGLTRTVHRTTGCAAPRC